MVDKDEDSGAGRRDGGRRRRRSADHRREAVGNAASRTPHSVELQTEDAAISLPAADGSFTYAMLPSGRRDALCRARRPRGRCRLDRHCSA